MSGDCSSHRLGRSTHHPGHLPSLASEISNRRYLSLNTDGLKQRRQESRSPRTFAPLLGAVSATCLFLPHCIGQPICQKIRQVSDDPNQIMSQLAQAILSQAQSLPEGGMLSPKEFLHLGSRAAIDQTLSRLAREGTLLRIGRGIYALPIQGRFGPRPPSTASVVEAIESASGETVVASGAAEANALGLTTQVPTREVYLTSGPSRRLKLGGREIELKHGNRWQMLLGKRPSGKAIRALIWLGPEQAPMALEVIRSKLSSHEWDAMRQARAGLPSWIAKAVSEVIDD